MAREMVGMMALLLSACAASTPGAEPAAAPEEPGIVQQAANTPVPLDVRVINTPLPTTAVGTTAVSGSVAATQSGSWNVGITGTPNVNATISGTPGVSAVQSGSWSVGIEGTPNVNATITGTPSVNATITGTPSVNATISGTPNVNVGSPTVSLAAGSSVVIGNSDSNPVPVTLSSGPARQQPFQLALNIDIFDGSTGGSSDLTPLPAGKRLVLEHINATATVKNGEIPYIELEAFNQGSSTSHIFAGTKVGTINLGGDFWVFNEHTLLYSYQDLTGVAVEVHRFSAFGFAQFRVVVTGHLEDM